MKNTLGKYGITIAAGAVISVLVMNIRGIFTAVGAHDIIRFISDGFFTAAVLIGGIGLLVLIGSKGLFDLLGYGVKFLFDLFMHPKKRVGSYYDYCTEKAEKRGKAPVFILLTGLGYLILAVIFTVIYYIV